MRRKVSNFFLLLMVLCFIYQPLFAGPGQVMIIRHGEKTKDKHDEYLSVKGLERAQALAPYFMGTKELLQYGLPVAIYAQGPGKIHHKTQRPIDTCTPIAKALGLSVNSNYTHDKYSEMVKEILNTPEYAGKNVLICWEHFMIPAMTQGFGVTNPPSPWPGDVFDRVWVIQFNKDNSVKRFQDLPQRLLFGDSSQ